jgi:CheY-like chemotaxis protein
MKKILVADDTPTGRELVRTVLEGSGFEIFEAKDGLEAVESARAILPDLIILDIHMPKLDGFGVVEELHRDRNLAATPILGLTASAMMGDKERAMAVGFTAYITKPIRLADLRSEVTRLLR